ncbi:MAG: c-type cytochrome [Bacteroidetes bacterium]|nr:c-type cytochrome [Bacteroidota bacterium]
MRQKALVLIAALTMLVAAFAMSGSRDHVFAEGPSVPIQKTEAGMSSTNVKYNPPLPKDAPISIRDAVMLGYDIMNHTRTYAGKYVGNTLNCSNCHFKEGSTEGGKNGGLSLVGVTTKYPEYRSIADGVVDIVSRTNSCFERSMDGKPLPPNSREMVGLITYFQWISKGLPIYEKIPWLGLKHIKSNHKPNQVEGKKIFSSACASCHGADGLGTKIAPPLWGKESFNDGAGMAGLANLVAFAHDNMPYLVSNLTGNEALDVAAFVTSQPRPHFTAK